MREAVGQLVLPDWVAKAPDDVSLRRLLDGQPDRRIGAFIVRGYPGLGDLSLTSVTHTHLAALMHEVRRATGELLVAQASARHDPRGAGDPHLRGHGAARNFALVTKRVFRQVREQGLLQTSLPSRHLRVPTPPEKRRPLTDRELKRFRSWIDVERRDPELDRLLLDLLRYTGARVGGLVTLRLDGLDVAGCWLRTIQKYGMVHTVPLKRSVLRRAADLARDRGAHHPDDLVLRHTDGRSVTRKYVADLFHDAQLAGVWRSSEPVSAHWLRYTCLSRIEEVSDNKVARTWAHHSRSREGPIGTYTGDARGPRLRRAAKKAFGTLVDEPIRRPAE